MATATDTSLPASALRDHFPGSFSEKGFSLKTDGDSLILQRVSIGGKLYDLRIYRWDADQQLIKVDGSYKILSHVVSEIQRTLQVYLEHHYRDNPHWNRYFYRDQPEWFCIRNRKGVDLDCTDYYKQEAINEGRDVMSKLHNMFFSESRVSHSSDRVDLVSPTMIAKDSFPKPSESHGIQSSVDEYVSPGLLPIHGHTIRTAPNNLEDEDIVDHEDLEEPDNDQKGVGTQTSTGSLDHVELPFDKVHKASKEPKLQRIRREAAEALPQAIVQKDQGTSPVSVGTNTYAEEAPYATVIDGLEEIVAPGDESCDYLKHINYGDLSRYSVLPPAEQQANSNHRLLSRALTAFIKLVQNPEDQTSDCKGMDLWLKALWQRAYQNYTQLRYVYDREDTATREAYNTFEKWCRHYAAKSIAGFVVSLQNLRSLVEKLEKLPIE